MRFHDPIKKCTNFKSKLPIASYKSKVKRFKLDEDPLDLRIYFLSLMNSLKILLSKFKETYILIMDYPSTSREYLPDYDKKDTSICYFTCAHRCAI